MKMKSVLFTVVLSVFAQGAAFAQQSQKTQGPIPIIPLTQDQLQRGIVILIEEGAIEWIDGRFVVRDKTVLDQLRQSGRVELQSVADHVICY